MYENHHTQRDIQSMLNTINIYSLRKSGIGYIMSMGVAIAIVYEDMPSTQGTGCFRHSVPAPVKGSIRISHHHYTQFFY